jgi:type IV secretion system protein TrbH
MRVLVLLVAIASLSGCQGMGREVGETANSRQVSVPAVSAIAGDMAARLTEQIRKQDTTSIRLPEDKTEFSVAFEAALKGWGYRIVTDSGDDKARKPIDVSFSLDGYEGLLLARVATPSLTLARTYSVTAAGATPSSPLSIMLPM